MSSQNAKVSRLNRLKWRLMRAVGMERAAWDQQHRAGMWEFEDKSPHLIEHVTTLAKGGDILEFGCGDGRLVDFLPDGAFATYLGSDISPATVALCQSRLGRDNVAFEPADMTTWTAPDRTFDLILLEECIYYLTPPQITRFLAECRQCLAPGGHLLVVIHSETKHRATVDHLEKMLHVSDRRTCDGRLYLTLQPD